MNASIQPQSTPVYRENVITTKHGWSRQLLLLLVVQVLLVIGIYAYQHQAQPQLEAQALLDMNIDSVDKWVISDASNSVTLVKSANVWQLPELHQLPVEAQKLDSLLDKLKGTKLTWPVATTESSHERFEVAESKFQRRISLFAGDKKLGDIFFGTSPGFKKVHLRRAGEKAVYAVELSSFEFSTTDKDWLETELLAAKQPRQIRGSDYQLQQEGDNWRFADDASAKVDNNKARALVDALSGFMVQEVAVGKPEGEAIRLEVNTAAGEWQYEFIKAGDDYFVRRNDRDLFFKVSAYEFERIAQIKKADLLEPVTPAEEGAVAGQETVTEENAD
ncbi:DUF4340 domain-containing protein [Cellvibrio japonicus]|uniref:DUF4340 domain-containing protein n=1 Tax=Cellvibrio japonicus (strain Ueda107) TaxID=498211 RepID=B3PBN2_CELJU|nr:DUF4340 domain-containing protein [Cellvibrio japonicus]ACE85583.1 hypothetical protein CJA_1096 [Cellvibrio japonicus Ueda107]QEI11706.1 DUF4340 domain-containing protein [Cellvibrio japonicus]QEI15280.1 DUF4340 domain-containing protein [Cellvibrio japonicus]QEI18860.1 DUF4340 domain-containing protein [Cellvibrio japonicus]